MVLKQLKSFFLFHNPYKKSNTKTTSEPLEQQRNEQAPASVSSEVTTPSIRKITVRKPNALPQVEFEESRNLLQLDFFNNNNSATTIEVISSFPKFEHLLQKHQEVQQQQQVPKKTKRTNTLRHKLSSYNKSLKRTLSTPNLYHKQ